MTTRTFQKAVRRRKKLRAAYIGPTGAGKTRTALETAQGFGGRIAVIDTEHGSASMFSDAVGFDTLELTSFDPARYIEAIDIAEAEGYDVIIIDSLSHAWVGKDGVLEFVDKKKQNDEKAGFRAWGQAGPMLTKLVERILTVNAHVIVTLRSKMEHVLEFNEKTRKNEVVKKGMQPVMRDGIEYEFDLTCDIDQDHVLRVAKTRIDELDGEVITKAGRAFGARIAKFLNSGAEPKKAAPPPEAVPAPAPNPPTATDETMAAIRRELKRLQIEKGQRTFIESLNDGAAIENEIEAQAVLEKLKKTPDRTPAPAAAPEA